MTHSHLIGLLLGAEEDWPQAFEAILRRVGQVPFGGEVHEFDSERLTHRAVRPHRPGAHRPGHRPARLLVLPPPRVAQEGRARQRHLPAQQPLHVPVDGEAQRLLRDDPPRPAGAKDRARALQEPGRQRPLGLHLEQVQPGVRPRRHRGGPRLPALHEAVRRRWLARGLACQQPVRAAPRLRRVRRDAHAPAGHGRVRDVRSRAVHRAGDDGHGLSPRPAHAQPVCRVLRLPLAVRRHAGRGDQPHRQRVLRLGVQLRGDARPW